MRNNLSPTVVTDKNGKVTTVHRRLNAVQSKTSSLSGIKPSLAPQPSPKNPSVDKIVKMKWKPSNESLPLSEGSFLDRVGLAEWVKEVEPNQQGHEMTRGEVFDFMKLGVTFHEAAALHQYGGNVDQWMDKPEFQNALSGIKRKVDLTETMELLKVNGVTINKAAKVVRNGLSDEHVKRSVLAPHELVTLFDRFKYQRSTNPDDTTNSTETMDAFIDGRLPFNLVEDMDASKSTITAVLYALYPPDKKKRSAVPLESQTLTDSARQELLSDSEKLSQTILVMSRYSDSSTGERLRNITETLDAIHEFGFDACMKHHPSLLSSRLSNGEAVGETRADEAKLCAAAMEDMESGAMPVLRRYPFHLSARAYAEDHGWMQIYYSDVAEFQLMGKTTEEIHDLLFNGWIDSNKALAIAQNQVLPVVSDGWL